VISPKVNAEIAEWFGEAPAQSKSCNETSDPKFCENYHAADPGFWKRVYYWNTPVSDCSVTDQRSHESKSTGSDCKDYNDWVQAWTEIKG
jgi:putative spermidine/putrescine transport system substrate-binding protein